MRYTDPDKRAPQGEAGFEAASVPARSLTQQQEIDRLSRALDMFAYSASHDLRSPLTTIMGLINLAEISRDEQEQSYYFAMMRKSVGKLDDLVREIVEVVMNSKLGLSTESINFRQLVKEKQEDLFYLKNYGKVKVALDLPPNAVPFYSDRNRLRVIVSNLLSNAIKFADLRKNPPLVSVSVRVSEQEALIEVADNGVGIASDHVPYIFDMFYRAHEYEVGPGLGLYIVKETVEVLGGSVQATSAPMKGTSITVRLPNMAPKAEE
jgi:signal transduction histidine kinase